MTTCCRSGGAPGPAGGDDGRLVVDAGARSPRRTARGYAETLTGFKWIVRGGPGLVYGYEEALGLLRRPGRRARQGRHRRRRAGVRPRRRAGAAGRALPDRLDELAVAHGVHLTEGLSVPMEPAARDAALAGGCGDAPRRRAGSVRAPGPGRAGAAPPRASGSWSGPRAPSRS